jgi:D-serine deaminase-like pyridoxal phosphate-dependent protein
MRYHHDYAYYKQVFGDHPMPFAYLDLDLLEQNIHHVVARAGGKRVRLASKSLRSVAVIRRILASDPCFQGLMCYTALEAVYLASQGFDDLLAYRLSRLERARHRSRRPGRGIGHTDHADGR